VRSIDLVKYGSTRNCINGAMTYLSPYISSGVISTKFILEEVLKKGYKANQIEKFIQEITSSYQLLLYLRKFSTLF
jgi:deoxyribodipyrimidine photo-lyase